MFDLFKTPESSANAALSPEDQKKRMLVQMLQKTQPMSAAPGAAEIGTGVAGGIANGLMMGSMMKPGSVTPGTAANGGWTTSVQPASLWSRMFG